MGIVYILAWRAGGCKPPEATPTHRGALKVNSGGLRPPLAEVDEFTPNRIGDVPFNTPPACEIVRADHGAESFLGQARAGGCSGRKCGRQESPGQSIFSRRPAFADVEELPRFHDAVRD